VDPWWLLVPAAYLIGTFPTAMLVGRAVGHDPTSEGSGNPGATNMYRVAGRRAAVLVLIGDLLKGVVPTAIGLLAGSRTLAAAAGAAAIIGHIAPATRGFRGGKGFATGAGVAFTLWPLVAICGLGVWLLTFRLFKRSSLSALLTIVIFPVGVWLRGRDLWEVVYAAAFGLVIAARHHENIRRLLRGEETTTARTSDLEQAEESESA
jgi:glycerol-3-phosphate acyltransferase PlsY